MEHLTFKTVKDAQRYFMENIFRGAKDQFEDAFDWWAEKEAIIVLDEAGETTAQQEYDRSELNSINSKNNDN